MGRQEWSFREGNLNARPIEMYWEKQSAGWRRVFAAAAQLRLEMGICVRQQKDILPLEFATWTTSCNVTLTVLIQSLRKEGHTQEGGDIQVVQEAIHPPNDGNQHGT